MNERKKKQGLKRLISYALAAAMLTSSIPTTVFGSAEELTSDYEEEYFAVAEENSLGTESVENGQTTETEVVLEAEPQEIDTAEEGGGAEDLLSDGSEAVETTPAIEEETVTESGLMIQVSAPENVFPTGTVVEAADVAETEMEALTAKIKEDLTEELTKEIVKVLAADITFKKDDVSLDPGTDVKVTLIPGEEVKTELKEKEEKGLALSLIYVPAEGEAVVVADEKIEAKSLDGITFNTVQFPRYAIVATVEAEDEIEKTGAEETEPAEENEAAQDEAKEEASEQFEKPDEETAPSEEDSEADKMVSEETIEENPDELTDGVVEEPVEVVNDAEEQVTSAKVEGIRSGYYTTFTAELSGATVTASVPYYFVSTGTTMEAAFAETGEYKSVITRANYGKEITDLKAVDVSFADKRGRKVLLFSVSLSIELSDTGAEKYVLYEPYRGWYGTELYQLGTSRTPKFSLYSYTDTYVIAGLKADEIDRIAGVTKRGITTFALKSGNVGITASADKNTFSGNVSMEAVPVEADAVEEAVNSVLPEGMTAESIQAFDISFHNSNDGEEEEPNKDVIVTIALPLNEEAEYSLVHVKDDGTVNVVENAEFSAEGVTFSTSEFSVYAVVEKGSTEEEARVTVNFYGKDTSNPVATFYVKNSDTAEEIEDIIYDPGVGTLDQNNRELFSGWNISTLNTTDGSVYTTETEGVQIDYIRNYLEGLEITEGDVVNIYALIFRSFTISYIGEGNKALGSYNALTAGTSATHTVNMQYTPTSAYRNFEGWLVSKGSSNIVSAIYDGETAELPYKNGTILTITGDVELSVDAPEGHWLVFNENGKGATYNAPKFVKQGEMTTEPSLEMKRVGYSFIGWYTEQYGDEQEADESKQFVFGGELEDNITIHAKWSSAETANYTVIVWKERMTDTYAENGGTGDGKDKNYDFAESFTFEGPVGQFATAVMNGTSSVVDGDDAGTRYYNARIQGTDVNTGTVDTTVAYTGYHCANYDKNVTVKPEGNSVVNVYYDRNTVTYTFYTYGSTTNGKWYLCRENGQNIKASGDRVYSWDDIGYFDGTEYKQYTGIVSHDDGKTYYYSQNGVCSGEQMREAHWEYKTSSTPQWNVYQKSTGLYGEALDWPTDTGIWWYENYSNATGTGTRMTYKDAFLPLDTDMTVEYWGTTASASGTIHFWTQDVNGTTYTDQVQVNTGNANFNINDKFTGFYAFQYRVDNGSWQNVGNFDESTGIYGNAVSFNTRLDIRYNRITATITFLDGAFYDGSGNPREDETPQASPFKTTQDYFYGGDVSSYNKGGADYYTPPEKTGYTFAGWYADDACTVEYNFGTMPASGITVYAKWILNEYRVFLHPNVPETDTSLNWGSETQAMNFRISSGNKVSVPTGKRTEYKLIGWYLDKNCTEVFDASRFVLNDTTVTTPYDKSVDMTDVMNKYGNIEGTGSNSDLTGYNGGDRFWINRKLDLYAKWRKVLVGADGIGIIYDDVDGDNAPYDTTLYLDRAPAIAQGAPTAPAGYQFVYWVLQTWDETEGRYVDTTTYKYPGDHFEVRAENARVVELEDSTPNDPSFNYTIQLRAEYAPEEVPTPTHLTWYDNYTDNPVKGVNYITDDNLKINEAVRIEPASLFSRDGYEFLGWARVPTTDNSGAELPGYTLSPRDLDEDDLFLKYEDGKFKAMIEGEWTEVEKVAADEKAPYHDLYAVWTPVFKVYYSGRPYSEKPSNPNPITIRVCDLPKEGEMAGKYNLLGDESNTTSKLTPGTLYGGYYRGTSTGFVSSKDAYDGDNWTWKGAVATNGMKITPTAGTTYYVKEVPIDKYQMPHLHYTYYDATGKLGTMWFISNLDDYFYREAGFIIETDTGKKGIIKKDVTFTAQNTGKTDKVDANIVNSRCNASTDYISYLKDDTYLKDESVASLTVQQYWLTPDGIKVVAPTVRTITFNDRTAGTILCENSTVNYTEVKGTVEYVGTSWGK